MHKFTRAITATAAVLTIVAVATWLLTGAHSYTKYRVVEQVETTVETDDPLAATGFYDEAVKTETVEREEFHLGLLPTPQGLIDKHAVSVASVAGPAWAAALLFGLLGWRRARPEQIAKGI